MIDAVRCAKLALDNGIAGALEWPSAYFMKSPPVQHPDDRCRDEVEAFIADEPAVETVEEEGRGSRQGVTDALCDLPRLALRAERGASRGRDMSATWRRRWLGAGTG